MSFLTELRSAVDSTTFNRDLTVLNPAVAVQSYDGNLEFHPRSEGSQLNSSHVT